jgi:hypothetical protein
MTEDERRRSPLRRQFNDAFSTPDGRISLSKTIAVFAQIAVLFHFGRSFDALIERPESLLIVLSFLVAPDIVKKALVMKLGGVK